MSKDSSIEIDRDIEREVEREMERESYEGVKLSDLYTLLSQNKELVLCQSFDSYVLLKEGIEVYASTLLTSIYTYLYENKI